MFRGLMLAALLLASGPSSGQTTGVLRVSITLLDATQTTVPVAQHALLISDDPPTREPRRVVTAADGSLTVNLAPGSYTVESDRPFGFLGKAYQWTAQVIVTADRQTTLALTAKDAEILSTNAATADTSVRTAAPDPAAEVLKWKDGVVTVWSPTSQAAAFVVDTRGLLATDRSAVGNATSVEVQVSSAVKVPARVLIAEASQDVAIVWVNPSVLIGPTPLPLACAPQPAAALDEGDEVVTMTPSPRESVVVESGEITGFHPRGIETDIRLPFGATGGPVFSRDYASIVGLTSLGAETDARRRGDVVIVRAGIICEALFAARLKLSGAEPPTPTPLPIEPARPYPAAVATSSASPGSAGVAPPVVASSDFDVAFLTPATVLEARERADWSGGRSVRPPQAEALLGKITDFGDWAEYFRDAPPVLVVRVTPRLVEGFWKRVAREAARTQGADLPAFKDFKTNFLRMKVTCGSSDVIPVHPFVLEHVVADKRVVREGVYVFAPEALGPHCGKVTMTLWSEQSPDKGETIGIEPQAVARIWQDFAPFRAAIK
jgi:hypothetical protein